MSGSETGPSRDEPTRDMVYALEARVTELEEAVRKLRRDGTAVVILAALVLIFLCTLPRLAP